jgi:phenylpyruvate tautomerase PptA (4-oxalocrotonate tautomerase family)
MPLYTITTQAGVLDSPAKADLADKLTAFHAEYAGVPKNWVHIVFPQLAKTFGVSTLGVSDILGTYYYTYSTPRVTWLYETNQLPASPVVRGARSLALRDFSNGATASDDASSTEQSLPVTSQRRLIRHSGCRLAAQIATAPSSIAPLRPCTRRHPRQTRAPAQACPDAANRRSAVHS